jgi:hypothetical protein
MYIMHRRLFDEYMDIWSAIIPKLTHLQHLVSTPEEGRFLGGLSERLLTLYVVFQKLKTPHFRLLELPVVTKNTRII